MGVIWKCTNSTRSWDRLISVCCCLCEPHCNTIASLLSYSEKHLALVTLFSTRFTRQTIIIFNPRAKKQTQHIKTHFGLCCMAVFIRHAAKLKKCELRFLKLCHSHIFTFTNNLLNTSSYPLYVHISMYDKRKIRQYADKYFSISLKNMGESQLENDHNLSESQLRGTRRHLILWSLFISDQVLPTFFINASHRIKIISHWLHLFAFLKRCDQ